MGVLEAVLESLKSRLEGVQCCIGKCVRSSI